METFSVWYNDLFVGTPYHQTDKYFLYKIKYLINAANEADPSFYSSVPALCDAHHIQKYLNENIKPIIDEWEQIGFEEWVFPMFYTYPQGPPGSRLSVTFGKFDTKLHTAFI